MANPITLCAAAALALCAWPAAAQDSESSGWLADWDAAAKAARAEQPGWSSPIATTSGLLEQRFRFDLADQHSGNGARTFITDGAKGLDFIVSESNEIQFALAPYEFRSATAATPGHAGFGDWAFLRMKQRLAASPSGQGNYVVTALLQVQAPTGIAPFTNGAWTFLPSLAAGKGWGSFDVQATLGAVIPTSHVGVLGRQLQTNMALQYHAGRMFWPELEINWTYYPDGQRGGLNQLFLTPGLTVARIPLGPATSLTTGMGYQVAISPTYRAGPLTPAYQHAFLFSTRVNF